MTIIILLFVLLGGQFLFFGGSVAAFDPVGTWSFSTELPYTVASNASIVRNAKIFNFGGANDFPTSQVASSQIGIGGVLGMWDTLSSLDLPGEILWHSIAFNEPFVYILGGYSFEPPTGRLNTVYLGRFSSENEIESWESVAELPVATALGAAAIVGDKLYYAGGFDQSNVYFATINLADGTLSSWTETTPLSIPLSGFSLIETGSHLIAIGGEGSSGVYGAEVHTDGTLSAPV